MDTQKYIPFLLVSALIFILLDLYFLLNFSKFLKTKNVSKIWIQILWSLALIVFISTGYTLWLRSTNQVPSNFEKFLFALPAVWYLPKAVITPILVIKDLINLAYKYYLKKNPSGTIISSKLESRRNFLQKFAWSLAGVPFIVVTDGLLRTTTRIETNQISIPIANLPANLEGLKIVQLTDIHAGSFSSPKMMEELNWMINIHQPDLIFITGDFVNFSPAELPLILPHLKSLSAKYGVYGCLGNHDHYMNQEDHKRLLDYLSNAGIKLLINENVTLSINNSSIHIAGVDNSSYRQNFGDFDRALIGLSNEYPTILLCHDPTNWDKEIKGKRKVDLMLSGHTHGGQIAIELFGTYLTPARYTYDQFKGLYSYKDQKLYISSGIGTVGPPVRIGVNPELTVVILTSPEKYA